MAGSLIKIDEEIVSSAVASVTLTGIDSTYDVYMVKFNALEVDTDSTTLSFRVTVSGTPDTTANYDRADKQLLSNTTFANSSSTNQTNWVNSVDGTGTGEANNGILYLFNFNNSSEYSFMTRETTHYDQIPRLISRTGGGVHTVAQACDGIHFYVSSGNIDNGTFTLYGLKKD